MNISIERIWCQLKRFQRHEEGTALLEFVMTAPIFLTVFVGIMHLGAVAQSVVEAEATAHAEAFGKALLVQNTKLTTGLTSGDALVHMSPVSGGVHAASQVDLYPARQNNTGLRGAIAAYEGATYFAGMSIGGHFGESYARLAPILYTNAVEMMGIDKWKTISPGPENMLGESLLAYDNVYDGPDISRSIYNVNTSVQNVMNMGVSQLPMLLGTVFNSFINATGSRATIGAGIRYGTVSGAKNGSQTILGFNYKVGAHYTVSVPPYVSGSPNGRALTASSMARVSMINQDFLIYNQSLSFGGMDGDGNPIGVGFNPDEPYEMDVPNPEDKFHAPLDY